MRAGRSAPIERASCSGALGIGAAIETTLPAIIADVGSRAATIGAGPGTKASGAASTAGHASSDIVG